MTACTCLTPCLARPASTLNRQMAQCKRSSHEHARAGHKHTWPHGKATGLKWPSPPPHAHGTSALLVWRHDHFPWARLIYAQACACVSYYIRIHTIGTAFRGTRQRCLKNPPAPADPRSSMHICIILQDVEIDFEGRVRAAHSVAGAGAAIASHGRGLNASRDRPLASACFGPPERAELAESTRLNSLTAGICARDLRL